MKKNRMKSIFAVLMSLLIILCSCGCVARSTVETKNVKSSKKTSAKADTEKTAEEAKTTTTKEQTTTTEAPTEATTTTEATTEETTETTTEATTEATTVETEEQTYEHNEFYDVVQVGKYTNSLGTQYLVHKVVGKKDVTISSTVIAYDDNGDVVGKTTDEICLTVGQTNFFEYRFDSDVDVKDENLIFSATSKRDNVLAGERNAVKMVKWNQKGRQLFITLEQTGDLGSFAKFKVLLFKDGEIVGAESGYIDIRTEGLVGVGSIDVADIYVSAKNYDDIEFIFEP